MSSRLRKQICFAAACALGTFASTAAFARDSRSPFIATFPEAAEAPQGFVEMCARDKVLCHAGLNTSSADFAQNAAAPVATGRGTAAALPFKAVYHGAAAIRAAVSAPRDQQTDYRMIQAVNSSVNRFTAQVSDIVSAGVEERWNRIAASRSPMGDCEDFAIEKRARLLEAGFSPERLFYSVVYKAGFGLHTVLIARLDDADYVLDSATPHILTWSKTKYVWLRAQSTVDPMLWFRVDTSPASHLANKSDSAPNAG